MKQMKFFIVGNRYGQRTWELLCTTPFTTFEEAQTAAAKMPTTWNATIVNTTNQGESK